MNYNKIMFIIESNCRFYFNQNFSATFNVNNNPILFKKNIFVI